jgi:hypothetical protein
VCAARQKVSAQVTEPSDVRSEVAGSNRGSNGTGLTTPCSDGWCHRPPPNSRGTSAAQRAARTSQFAAELVERLAGHFAAWRDA